MAPPTLIDLYGDPAPIPLDQLQDEQSIRAELVQPGTPFDCEERLIGDRLQTVYKNLVPDARTLWLTSAETFSHRQYIVCGQSERYTYGQALQQSIKVSSWLQTRFQIRKGDRVGIAARNWPEFVFSFWAIHLLGAIACPLNSFNEGDTLAFCIRDVGCRVVIVDGERCERLQSHLQSLQSGGQEDALQALVVMPRIGTRRMKEEEKNAWRDKQGVFDWDDLMASVGSLDKVPSVDVSPDDDGLIMFTSGTTGKPKGVLSSQRQFLGSIAISAWALARTLRRRRRPLPQPPPTASMDQRISLILVPLMHVTGLHSGLLNGTATGSRICLMPAYSKQAAAEIAEREKVSSILGVGWMLREIAQTGADLSSVQTFSHGGATSPKELAAELLKRNPSAISSNGFGMTEVNGAASAAVGDDYHAHPTSVGMPSVGVEFAIVDADSGVKLPANTRGELWIKSACRAKRYWNRPKETAAAFLSDGWFRSGDVAYQNEDGFLFIVDRMKEVIVRGGENISSGQVENAVYSHADIIECAAVALPEPQLGERVAVVCVVKEGRDLPSKESIIAAAAKTLPKYCVPEYVWVRREPLERNLTGKVLKTALKTAVIERAKEEGWQAKSREAKL